MALLFFDGFDTATTAANIVLKYSTSVGVGRATGRTGINCLDWLAVSGEVKTKTLPVSGTTAIIGVAIKTTGFGSTSNIIEVYEGSTLHMAVGIDGSGHLLVLRNTTTLATSSSTISTNTWYYVEFKTVIHDSTGTYEVRVDGSTFGGLTATGQDTRNGGSGTWDAVALGGFSSGQSDDLYICDGSGSLNNDFLGDSKVETLLPQTDAVAAGSHADFTPSTGTDHGALVDETNPNTSDYNSSSTVGHIDSYNYPSLTLTGTIRGVQVSPFHAKTDAGARTVSTMTRVASTDYVNGGTAISPPTTFGYDTQVFETNPNSGVAWTASDVNSAEFGLKIIS